MKLTGADIIAEILIEQGCDLVFGYPGGQVINLYDALYTHKDAICHVLTAHEQGAVHAADGYARSTGKTGVVIATSGPGATNLVTGIATAHLDSIPMVAITGNVATYKIGYDSFQEIDITGITLPITKHNYFVGSVEELADTLREAFTLAQSGRKGPVLVDVPKDVQEAMCEFSPAPKAEAEETQPAKDIRIEAAAACINKAKRPYIYFGGGVLSGNAIEEMLALAELIDAPLGSSLMGLSAVPSNHPRFLGMHGMHGHYASTLCQCQADCIISLGVRFSERMIGNKDKYTSNASIVHIDIDGSELSKIVPATHNLRGDMKKTLAKLLPLLNKKENPQWQETVQALRRKEASLEDMREGLTPKNCMALVNHHIKEDTPIVTDVGQHQMWAAQYVQLQKPRTFITSGGLGTMGFGMGAAIGAQMATGKRPLLITGDGSFGMSLAELATAVSHKVPMVILIMNNGVLGMVRQMQTLFFDKHYSATDLNRKTDFVALSKAFGAKGVSVQTPEELDKALQEAFTEDGPYVIDCSIDPDEFVLPMMPPDGTVEEMIIKAGNK